jgi:hypothetical protein
MCQCHDASLNGRASHSCALRLLLLLLLCPSVVALPYKRLPASLRVLQLEDITLASGTGAVKQAFRLRTLDVLDLGFGVAPPVPLGNFLLRELKGARWLKFAYVVRVPGLPLVEVYVCNAHGLGCIHVLEAGYLGWLEAGTWRDWEEALILSAQERLSAYQVRGHGPWQQRAGGGGAAGSV